MTRKNRTTRLYSTWANTYLCSFQCLRCHIFIFQNNSPVTSLHYHIQWLTGKRQIMEVFVGLIANSSSWRIKDSVLWYTVAHSKEGRLPIVSIIRPMYSYPTGLVWLSTYVNLLIICCLTSLHKWPYLMFEINFLDASDWSYSKYSTFLIDA